MYQMMCWEKNIFHLSSYEAFEENSLMVRWNTNQVFLNYLTENVLATLVFIFITTFVAVAASCTLSWTCINVNYVIYMQFGRNVQFSHLILQSWFACMGK